MPSEIKDLNYEAIEPLFNRLRLASDTSRNVFIMTCDDIPYSAPFAVALTGELFRTTDRLETMMMHKQELDWVYRMRSFAKSLSAVEYDEY